MAIHAKDVQKEWRAAEKGFARRNRKIGEAIAGMLGSMGFFWACAMLDVLALPGLVLTVAQTLGYPVPQQAVAISVMVTIVSFISQTVIQLLALPVLQYSGNLAQKAADARAEATYRNTSDAEKRLAEILAGIVARGEENATMEEQNNQILKHLEALHERPAT